MATLRDLIYPVRCAEGEYAALFEAIGGARLVLIGEASHGTHNFCEIRAELTKRLIANCGFAGVASEADWPDAYRFCSGARWNSHGATVRQPRTTSSLQSRTPG